MTKKGWQIKNEFAYVIGVVVSNSRASVRPDLDLIEFPSRPVKLPPRGQCQRSKMVRRRLSNRLEVGRGVCTEKGEEDVL